MNPLVSVVIVLILGLVIWGIIRDRNKWKNKYDKKVSYIFSTDYEIGKEIHCVDTFYTVYNNKVCKFKTESIELKLTLDEEGYPIYKIGRVEGRCIEGPGNLIEDRKVFTPDNLFISKNSLLDAL